MSQLKVWFTVSEAEGLVKSGGLADVGKALPKSLQNLGSTVAIAIPGYTKLPNFDQSPVVLSTKLDHFPHTSYQVRKLDLNGVPVYAFECDQYFDRPELYAERNEAYADNGERFAFFSAASLDALPKLDFKPDVIHANDWHTGLVPFLLKTRFANNEFYKNMKSVLSVHNALFKGIYPYREVSIIPELSQVESSTVNYGHDCISMLRAGIQYADKLNAVSPNYAQELKTPLGSHGLVNDFVARQADFCGIVNGCDYSEWDPATDKYLAKKFKATKASFKTGKAANKIALQNEFGLPVAKLPMFGMVCRLTDQKGFHYILPILERFLKNDVQIVIIGTGDPAIAAQLRQVSEQHLDKFTFVEAYDNRLAHLVEAGSDFFLMPSEFEACGLNQLYSMAYGTLPIVRSVGGLKDTVNDYDTDPSIATGFAFREPKAEELLICMQRALLLYLQQPSEFSEMQLRAMTKDFSWDVAAEKYLEMFKSAF
ncbi:starch synthase [Vibrio sp. UCD-FRSSP16_10]|uniref:glycogen synthase GlgA n=1 Tax=unclassified Vibrio TaxID=2614977 RepID=UPI0007FFE7CF|nr:MULTISPECIES: glycogen synthase GlgA [unclassified Vibrio]OBT13942.1 starch synthase [Vibrio sp. UCD-FRSSP16_30]OBT22823.1 starch synthase [Vibrio sp. UCD-FRSSP16_10]